MSHSSTEGPFSTKSVNLQHFFPFKPGGITKRDHVASGVTADKEDVALSTTFQNAGWIFILCIFKPLVKTQFGGKGISCVFPVSGHNAAATLTGVTGRSLWTLTNSAGGPPALTGGSSGGRVGGSGGGRGGGGEDTSVTYSDR